MSLYGALFTGVSGLNSQGQKIGMISDNIANVNTVGYKRAQANFQSLVLTSPSNGAAYSPGGALVRAEYQIDKAGPSAPTSNATDISIAGSGFFVVKTNATSSAEVLYTRAGSFREDKDGNLVNANGFFLQAWPLDAQGLLPGQPNNLNTTSSTNVDSMENVNVTEHASSAQATTKLDLAINLDAGETVFPGAGVTVTMDPLAVNTNNTDLAADDIIVPDETSAGVPSFGLATTNGIARGDKFTATVTDRLNNSTSYDYTYGGFVMGRDITNSTPSTNLGDGAVDLSVNGTPYLVASPLLGAEIVTDGATNTVLMTLASTASLTTGDTIVLSGISWAGAETIPLTQINTTHTITVINPTTISFTTTTASTVIDANAAGGTFTNRPFVGNIFDASGTNTAFLGTTGTTPFTSASLSFTIETPASGEHTFTYTQSSPNSANGQFNTLNGLATAIANTAGLTARVVGGRLVVGSKDATESVTFANGDATGTATASGLDWISELDLADVAAATRRFSTMNSLADIVNGDTGMAATVENPVGPTTMDIRAASPLSTVAFEDYLGDIQALGIGDVVSTAGPSPATVTITLAGHGLVAGSHVTLSGMAAFDGFTVGELNTTFTVVSAPTANTFTIAVTTAGVIAGAANGAAASLQVGNIGSLLGELGIKDNNGDSLSLQSAAYTQQSTGNLGPAYDSAGATGQGNSASSGHNMASGDITPQYGKSVRIYDSLGTGHDVQFSYIKLDDNEWAFEAYAVPETDISTTLPNGQISSGTIKFNGDGSLYSVSPSLVTPVSIQWTNEALDSTLDVNFGTAGLPFGTPGATVFGKTDGMSQYDSDYNLNFVNQDGATAGQLNGVTIDAEGYVIGHYTNGENQKLYKVAIADFINPNGLEPRTGNVFAQTATAGELYLRESGTNGVGTIQSQSLEQSNVDLATELTDMIIAQRAYQANTKVITTADQLLDKLTQI